MRQEKEVRWLVKKGEQGKWKEAMWRARERKGRGEAGGYGKIRPPLETGRRQVKKRPPQSANAI